MAEIVPDFTQWDDELYLAKMAFQHKNYLHMIMLCYKLLENMLQYIIDSRKLPSPTMGKDLHFLADAAGVMLELCDEDKQVLTMLSSYHEEISLTAASKRLRRILTDQNSENLLDNTGKVYVMLKNYIKRNRGED